MHPVPRRIVGAHGEKRAGTDVKCHGVKADAALGQASGERLGEMEPGGGRRNRALGPREQGLVIGAVALIGAAARRDIGRKRHRAALGNRLVEHGTRKGEAQRDLARFALGFDGRVKLAEKTGPPFLAETHHVTDLELARGLCQRLPARAVEPPDQRCLDSRLDRGAEPPAAKLRRDHLGVVDDKLIARAQQIGQVAHHAILAFDRAAAAPRTRPHHQQPRGIAW